MNWTRPSDLHAQVRRMWDGGRLLASIVIGDSLFPQRLALKGPTSVEMADRFGDVREWIEELRKMQHIRLEMRERNHRVLGRNAAPSQAWVDTLDDAVAMIGKRREVVRFTQLIAQTRQHQPTLLGWLAKRPLRALELYDDWERLLSIVAWLQLNPRPGIYLRQVDIADVHSKFIESHRGILQELLDLVLPPTAIDPSASGVASFAKRYGFLDKPQLIRFRILDASRELLPGQANQDMTLDATSFCAIKPNISRVFVTENEINFLALPSAADSMVVFGGGYGFDVLRPAKWLNDRAIYYWGDIDTHGFAILDQLRSVLPQAKSFLMDRQTLLAHESQWVNESQPAQHDLVRLEIEERALYDDLRDNRLGPGVRLEQERIRYGWFQSAMNQLLKEGE